MQQDETPHQGNVGLGRLARVVLELDHSRTWSSKMLAIAFPLVCNVCSRNVSYTSVRKGIRTGFALRARISVLVRELGCTSCRTRPWEMRCARQWHLVAASNGISMDAGRYSGMVTTGVAECLTGCRRGISPGRPCQERWRAFSTRPPNWVQTQSIAPRALRGRRSKRCRLTLVPSAADGQR